MTCYQLETEYKSGRRFIPARRTNGKVWLDTQYVAEVAADALEGAQISDARERGPEWAAENELIGVAEVDLTILALHLVEAVAPAGAVQQ